MCLIINLTYLEYFILGDVRFVPVGCDCSECPFHFGQRLDVLCFATDHERHVIFETDVSVSVHGSKASSVVVELVCLMLQSYHTQCKITLSWDSQSIYLTNVSSMYVVCKMEVADID